MSLKKIGTLLENRLNDLEARGASKGKEQIVTGIKAANATSSRRYFLAGYGDRAFLKMNSNSYLGLSLNRRVIEAEAQAADRFGTGPGAVRFISGTYQPHVELEQKLAAFHGREAGMLMSAAYATVMGVLPLLITEETLVVSDALNHNCIINAIRLSRPGEKTVYEHLNMDELDGIIAARRGQYKRVCVVTDGVFSMRGDHAPLDRLIEICERYQEAFEEGVISIVDDSHGVGAFGSTGRGTEDYTHTRADILIATLGKAFGVNGGYVVSSANVIRYLRETSPFYIYSNPITPAEAAAALESVAIVDTPEGLQLLQQTRRLSARLREGLKALGLETIDGMHPIVPLLVRDTRKTSALVDYLFENCILVTGLNYPVVPRGEQSIRLQVSAEHNEKDIDFLLDMLQRCEFLERRGK